MAPVVARWMLRREPLLYAVMTTGNVQRTPAEARMGEDVRGDGTRRCLRARLGDHRGDHRHVHHHRSAAHRHALVGVPARHLGGRLLCDHARRAVVGGRPAGDELRPDVAAGGLRLPSVGERGDDLRGDILPDGDGPGAAHRDGAAHPPGVRGLRDLPRGDGDGGGRRGRGAGGRRRLPGRNPRAPTSRSAERQRTIAERPETISSLGDDRSGRRT